MLITNRFISSESLVRLNRVPANPNPDPDPDTDPDTDPNLNPNPNPNPNPDANPDPDLDRVPTNLLLTGPIINFVSSRHSRGRDSSRGVDRWWS